MIRKTINFENTQQLYAKITKLEVDKEKLRLLLHELIEAFYQVINKPVLCLPGKTNCATKEKNYD